MIDPKTVLLAIPSHTGSMSCELSGMLINYGHRYFGGLTMPTECSHPSLVRNIIADTFLRSPFEWLVGVDSDMVVGETDFEVLLQEIDPHTRYFLEADGGSDSPPGAPTQPTRVEAPTVLTDTDVQGRSRQQVNSALCDVLVNCEYAYKREPFEPVHFGLGFYRVHRSVFSMLQQLKHLDNGRIEVDRTDTERLLAAVEDIGVLSEVELKALVRKIKASVTSQAGAPRLWQCMYRGRLYYDYYPSGPIVDLHVPNGQWMGEDHGFWTLCRLAGLIPRIETRTRLLHLGRKAYPYLGPTVGVYQ